MIIFDARSVHHQYLVSKGSRRSIWTNSEPYRSKQGDRGQINSVRLTIDAKSLSIPLGDTDYRRQPESRISAYRFAGHSVSLDTLSDKTRKSPDPDNDANDGNFFHKPQIVNTDVFILMYRARRERLYPQLEQRPVSNVDVLASSSESAGWRTPTSRLARQGRQMHPQLRMSLIR